MEAATEGFAPEGSPLSKDPTPGSAKGSACRPSTASPARVIRSAQRISQERRRGRQPNLPSLKPAPRPPPQAPTHRVT